MSDIFIQWHIEQLERQIKDTHAILETVRFLPTRLEHRGMVSFNDVCSMDGKIIDTNSYFVRCGDYVVEKTASGVGVVMKEKVRVWEERVGHLKSTRKVKGAEEGGDGDMKNGEEETLNIEEKMDEEVERERVRRRREEEGGDKKTKIMSMGEYLGKSGDEGNWKKKEGKAEEEKGGAKSEAEEGKEKKKVSLFKQRMMDGGN